MLQFQADLGDRAGLLLHRLGDHRPHVVERAELSGGVGDRAGRLGEDDRTGSVDARHSPGSMDPNEAGALPLDRPWDQHVDDVRSR
jgi:hypothetical protein